jgi:hypothetical protein
MIIIAIDPGKTTGLAKVKYNNSKEFQILDWASERGVVAPVQWAFDNLPADVILCENFRLVTAMAKEVSVNDPHLHSAQIIGGCKVANAELKKPVELLFPYPNARVSVDMLYKLGLGDVGDRHVKDALCHIVSYCLKGYKKEFKLNLKMKGA